MRYSCSDRNERRSLAGFIPKGLYGRQLGSRQLGSYLVVNRPVKDSAWDRRCSFSASRHASGFVQTPLSPVVLLASC
jgi:hypothetical protein